MVAQVLAAGLKDFAHFIEELPELTVQAAALAINDTSRDTVPLLKRIIRSQVAFPGNYLNQDRLGIRRRATARNLEAVISGRDRPTSLARFAEGATPQNSRGRPVIVRVEPGKPRTLNRAFLVALKNGNIGLAIRLPKGQHPDKAYKPVELTRGGGQGEGAWLLYGPSVDQVMEGVIPEAQDQVGEMLEKNFVRQFDRLTNG